MGLAFWDYARCIDRPAGMGYDMIFIERNWTRSEFLGGLVKRKLWCFFGMTLK